MTDESLDRGRPKIALLIDGDNAQPSLIEKILDEVSKYGQITVRRIYGDWTTSNMNGWKDTLSIHAVQPIQQFRFTVGKNATDSAMIIDAMDILHSEVVDIFCIVSSDSDYTRLATRIREEGIRVIGIGREQTPKAFVSACHIFIFTENLAAEEPELEAKSKAALGKDKTETTPDPMPLLKQAFEAVARDDGWANLAQMGLHLHQIDPSFDPRTYGFRQLSKLINAYKKTFEVRLQDKNGPTKVYVRMKSE